MSDTSDSGMQQQQSQSRVTQSSFNQMGSKSHTPLDV
jgi:hypothetical protein